MSFIRNTISRLTQGQHRTHTEKKPPIKDKKTRMQNAISTLKIEIADTVDGSTKLASKADQLMVELKTIESGLDAKFVSERIKMWTTEREAANFEKQQGHSAEERIEISARKKRTTQRVDRARHANTRKILSETARSYIPINRTQAAEVRAKVESALSEAANIVANIKENEEHINIRMDHILFRLNPLQRDLVENGIDSVDEFIYHDVRGEKLNHRQHFLDNIKVSFNEMVDLLESMNIMIKRLTVILEEMNQLVPPSIEPEANIPQEDILRNAFDKLYEDYKKETTAPKEIPEYFVCHLALDTIMFPMSYTNDEGFIYTYDRDYITRYVSEKKRHPETREEVEITEFVPDDIFNGLLDEFIIDPDAYYKKYNTEDYQEAYRHKSKLTKAMGIKTKQRKANKTKEKQTKANKTKAKQTKEKKSKSKSKSKSRNTKRRR